MTLFHSSLLRHLCFIVLILSPVFACAQTNKKTRPQEFRLVSSVNGNDQVYRITIVEDEILQTSSRDKIQIVLKVAFYKGYFWAAGSEANMQSGQYTLQRTSLPVKAGNDMRSTWKIIKRDGKDLLAGRVKDKVQLTLDSGRDIQLELSEKDILLLQSELQKSDPYDDM